MRTSGQILVIQRITAKRIIEVRRPTQTVISNIKQAGIIKKVLEIVVNALRSRILIPPMGQSRQSSDSFRMKRVIVISG